MKDKEIFVQLLYQEFSDNQNNMIMEKQISKELLTLFQKKIITFMHIVIKQKTYLSQFLERIK